MKNSEMDKMNNLKVEKYLVLLWIIMTFVFSMLVEII